MARTIMRISFYSALRLTDCYTAIPVGTGGGADVCTRVKGELICVDAIFYPTENATIPRPEDLRVTVEKKHQTGGDTAVRAPRSKGAPAMISVRTTRDDMTEVAVRCGYSGGWGRNTAERIHATIPDTI